MTKESFAKNIYRARKAKGWSQQKLADLADVSYQTVFRAEAGSMPQLKNLQKIAKALGVTESELLGSGPKPSQQELSPETIKAIQEVVKESLEKNSPSSQVTTPQTFLELPEETGDLIADITTLLPSLHEKHLKSVLSFVRTALRRQLKQGNNGGNGGSAAG